MLESSEIVLAYGPIELLYVSEFNRPLLHEENDENTGNVDRDGRASVSHAHGLLLKKREVHK